MTAAHCVHSESGKKLATDSLQVRLGVFDRTNPNETGTLTFGVTEILSHENYIGATTRNDIAVLKLDGSVDPKQKRIYPICMPERGRKYLGTRCLVAGWGYISRVRLANALQETNLTVTSRDECEEALDRTVTKAHMCAKAQDNIEENPINVCKGDSGGPLMCVGPKKSTYEICGIVSFGRTDCTRASEHSAFSRVTEYIDWIYKKIGGCEEGSTCKSDCPFVKSRQDVIDTLDSSFASRFIKILLQGQIDARSCSDDSSEEKRFCCDVKKTKTSINNSSECCNNIEIIQGNSEEMGGLRSQPEIFTSYTLEPELHDGRARYVTQDGTKAIALGHGNWEVQTSYDG